MVVLMFAVPYSQLRVVEDFVMMSESKIAEIIWSIEYAGMSLVIFAVYLTVTLRRHEIRNLINKEIHILSDNFKVYHDKLAWKVVLVKMLLEIVSLVGIVIATLNFEFSSSSVRFHMILVLAMNFVSFFVTNIFVCAFLLFSYQLDGINNSLSVVLKNCDLELYLIHVDEYGTIVKMGKSLTEIFARFCVANFIFLLSLSVGEVS